MFMCLTLNRHFTLFFIYFLDLYLISGMIFCFSRYTIIAFQCHHIIILLFYAQVISYSSHSTHTQLILVLLAYIMCLDYEVGTVEMEFAN